jgi:hypothetical protein
MPRRRRVALRARRYRAGALNATLNVWCGVLLIGVAGWLLWDLWNATTPKPITDDFLKLLDDSFGRDWRKPRSWPWARLAWAYGFTLVGLTSALVLGLLLSAAISSSTTPKAPTVETSQSFRLVHLVQFRERWSARPFDSLVLSLSKDELAQESLQPSVTRVSVGGRS